MWLTINSDKIDDYLNQYPKLKEHTPDIFLHETDDKIILPRYLYKQYPSQLLEIYEEKNFQFEKTKFTFKGNLRIKQKPIVEKILNTYQEKNQINGIIKAFPGIGKTVLSIYVASKLGFRTCILVDNSSLLEQWIKEIYNFTNLTEKDIGIIQGKLISTNKPIVVAMVQTICSKIKTNFEKFFESIDSAKFNLLIIDECHKTSSAPKFSKASLFFRTKNIIGLSATPFHQSTPKLLMENTIGKIIYQTKDYDLTPKYFEIFYNSEPENKKIVRQFFAVRDFNHRRAIYNELITHSKMYYKVINHYIQRLLKSNYRVMIICFTKKQVKTISEYLRSNNIENRRYYGDEKEIDKENDKVIVATYSYAGTGFDFKNLSALLLACPLAGKKSLIQVIGRILRTSKEKNQTPVVLDLIDTSFPSYTLPLIKMKEKVVRNEFNCKIYKIEPDNI